jgi:2-polyprenyl-3-methyl-5-hydroxy-6-metoxy-1,4-benzoquinol methylase
MIDTCPVRCPACGAEMAVPPLAAAHDAVGDMACHHCGRSFASYRGIVDLRSAVPPTCWTTARTVPERDLARGLAEAFDDLDLKELVRSYVAAHDLPQYFLDGTAEYFQDAYDREAWTLQYMEFCALRYAGRDLSGARMLEAGCGSGGALPRLARSFRQVAGVDPDLPALLIAAKRCHEHSVSDRVVLVAGLLEQRIWPRGEFDAIKCTDVIEHVADPDAAARTMAEALAPRGVAFVLTPNRWSVLGPEPHVRLWGVQFLPRRLADAYVRRRIGIRYSDIARLLSYRGLMRVLRSTGARVRFVPIEDKHLNPRTNRGRRAKRWLARLPLRWVSTAVRPFQPTLEAVVIRPAVRGTADR